jgi:hypothetical protein
LQSEDEIIDMMKAAETKKLGPKQKMPFLLGAKQKREEGN